MLDKKILSKKSIIGVIGLGYVGLPLVKRFSDEGYKTFGFDIDKEKIEMLNKGVSYIKHIESDKIKTMIKNRFCPTNDFKIISDLDVIIICVPTPLDNKKEPDLSFIIDTIDAIKKHLKKNQLLILESTSYPGTTEEKIIPMINNIVFTDQYNSDDEQLNVGKNFFVGYSPERIDPGNDNFTIKTIPKIVSGYSLICSELINLLYSQIVVQTIPVSSMKVAEMTKILENIFRAVNIGLVNELKMVADKLGIDIFEVINAASTKPFGFTPFYPGPGLGGHCVPIDPYYLHWKAKEEGIETRFIKLAGEINTKMPDYVIDKIETELKKVNINIGESKILILGLAYKKNIGDTRESPSLRIIDKLLRMGSNVNYSDPFVPTIPKTRDYNLSLDSVSLDSSTINKYDIVVLITNHDSFNYELIQKHSKIIIDTRGTLNLGENVVRA